jgi:hypothetical protein
VEILEDSYPHPTNLETQQIDSPKCMTTHTMYDESYIS